MKIKSWKFGFTLSILLLIISNLYWFFIVIDNAVTEKYQSMEMDHQRKLIIEMGYLIVNGSPSKNKKDVIYMLRQIKPTAFIVDNGHTVIYENIAFHFKNGQLVEVSQ